MSRKAAGPSTLSILCMFDLSGLRIQHVESGVSWTTLSSSARNNSPNLSFSIRLGDLLNLSGVELFS